MNTVLNTPQVARITLYYREGSSDKVYQAIHRTPRRRICRQLRLWSPRIDHEHRHQNPNAGGLRLGQDHLRQTGPGEEGQGLHRRPGWHPVSEHTDKEDRVTGLLPQLLNPIDEQEVKRLLKDPAFVLQEKFDGRRVLVRKAGAEIHGINRKGLLIGLPSPIVVGAHKITSDFILDGECVGDVLYAFDLLEWDGEDYRPKPYQRRFVKLSTLLNRPDITHIEFAETATDPANKERLFRQSAGRGEGRRGVQAIGCPVHPGRPNSGGTQLKHKFYATCSAVVSKINDKRSVELRLLNGKRWIPVRQRHHSRQLRRAGSG